MAKKVNFSQMKAEIKKMIAEVGEISEGEITEDARFAEDLGVDSMMALEIVATIEKKYRIAIPEEEIPKIRSLKDVYNLLEGLLTKK